MKINKYVKSNSRTRNHRVWRLRIHLQHTRMRKETLLMTLYFICKKTMLQHVSKTDSIVK